MHYQTELETLLNIVDQDLIDNLHHNLQVLETRQRSAFENQQKLSWLGVNLPSYPGKKFEDPQSWLQFALDFLVMFKEKKLVALRFQSFYVSEVLLNTHPDAFVLENYAFDQDEKYLAYFTFGSQELNDINQVSDYLRAMYLLQKHQPTLEFLIQRTNDPNWQSSEQFPEITPRDAVTIHALVAAFLLGKDEELGLNNMSARMVVTLSRGDSSDWSHPLFYFANRTLHAYTVNDRKCLLYPHILDFRYVHTLQANVRRLILENGKIWV